MESSLDRFVNQVSSVWGPLRTPTVDAARAALEQLVRADPSQDWLASLHRAPPDDLELYRHPDRGFLLLAHAERRGRYRPPHDHGAGWVMYAVLHGEIEMGTYGVVSDAEGERLVRREVYRLHAGDVRVYLPGDVHDTRCVSDLVLMLRFTSCDLKREAKEGRLTRYVSRDGEFTRGEP